MHTIKVDIVQAYNWDYYSQGDVNFFFSGYLLDCDIKNIQSKVVSIINKNNTKHELKKLVLSLRGHFSFDTPKHGKSNQRACS